MADAAEVGRSPLLRVDLEFVTPSGGASSSSSRRGILGPAQRYGIEEYPAGASMAQIVARARQRLTMRPPACVSLCISLVQTDGAGGPARKQAERELDMHHLKLGSSRRVLHLPPSSMGLGSAASPSSYSSSGHAHAQARARQGLPLPTTLISLAQHLQKAHRFSAMCPTTGHTARHSPRDLHHGIEAHDEKYVGKLQAAQAAQAERTSPAASPAPVPAPGSTAEPEGTVALSRLSSNHALWAPLSSSNPLLGGGGDAGAASGSSTGSGGTGGLRVCIPLSSAYPGGPPILLWDDPAISAQLSASASSSAVAGAEATGTESSLEPSPSPAEEPSSSSDLSYNASASATSHATSSGSGSAVGSALTHSSSFNSLTGHGTGTGIGRRVKERVRKKLKGRQGEVDEEDLANWITPLDLDEVGG